MIKDVHVLIGYDMDYRDCPQCEASSVCLHVSLILAINKYFSEGKKKKNAGKKNLKCNFLCITVNRFDSTENIRRLTKDYFYRTFKCIKHKTSVVVCVSQLFDVKTNTLCSFDHGLQIPCGLFIMTFADDWIILANMCPMPISKHREKREVVIVWCG